MASIASPTNRGTDEPLLQRQNYEFDWQSGATTTEEWRGINPAKMTAKYNGLVYTVTKAKLELANGMASATFQWSGAGGGGSTSDKALTIDRWEIPEPKTEKPVVSAPGMYNAFYLLGSVSGGLGTSDAAIANYMARFQKGIAANTPASTLGTITGWLVEANFPGWDNFVISYSAYAALIILEYQACLAGQTHYQSSTYAVRHTTNAPAYWSANVSDNNVNRVYTLAQLLSELQSSSLWYYPLPGRLAYKLSAATNDFINSLPANAYARSGYLVGWLKSPFGEASTGRNRIEIQGGYVLDQWPLRRYPQAS